MNWLPDREPRWRPTPAHLRAVAMTMVCLGVAAIWQRVDIAILGAPFLAMATSGALRRPPVAPAVRFGVDETTLFEGQTTVARVTLEPPALEGTGTIAAAVVRADQWLQFEPSSGARAVASDGGAVSIAVPVRGLRWGRREVTLAKVACTSVLGAFRTVGLYAPPVSVTTLPLGDEFSAVDAMPRPAGLVGLHRSRRHGEGTELAEVRPFRPGDRLRRINWAVSSRTRTLHVTATWSDHDTDVVLLLDTEHDLGVSEGIDGRASSLDTAVRAAAAIAEHYLRAGDRVSLFDLGRRVRDVRSGGGRRHLRRILDVLVASEPAVALTYDFRRLPPPRPGSLVVALSPLVGTAALVQVAQLVQHGHTVIIVDTLPDMEPRPAAPALRGLAQRVRDLERGVDIDRLGELGVPVVHWRGPGTLDEVLRDVSRLPSAPRAR